MLDQITHHMNDKGVSLLDMRGHLGRHHQGEVDKIANRTAVASEQASSPASFGDGKLKGKLHIRGVPAGGDANDQVPADSQGFDLSAKNPIETVIVAYGSQDRSVRSQCDSRQCPPLSQKPADQLGGKVLGICSRAAIAHNKNFVAPNYGFYDQFSKSLNVTTEKLSTGLHGLHMCIESRVYFVDRIQGMTPVTIQIGLFQDTSI